MKKTVMTVALLFTVLFSTTLSAQGQYGKDSAECVKYLSFYRDYLKQRDYENASQPWREAYRLCPPQASQNMLIDGQKIMKFWIDKQTDKEIRKSMIDTLMNLHDLRCQYYPKYKMTALTNKAIDMGKYSDDNTATYNTMLEAVRICRGKSFPAPGIIVLLMNKASELYNAGTISGEEVMSVYSEITEISEDILSRKKSVALESAMKDVENLFVTSGVASCDNIVALFGPKYDANPSDVAMLKGIVKLMSDAQCTDADLFYNALNSLHAVEPSYQTAYYLYKLNASRNNIDEAVAKMQEAIASEASDSMTDADYYLEFAAFYYRTAGNLPAAVEAAKKAMELNPNHAGKANYLIATVWASADCQGNPIEQKARFWVAVDYLTKAKKADPTLAEDCDNLISNYRKHFPLKEDAFMYDVYDGNSYTVSCKGMRETTTVRTQN